MSRLKVRFLLGADACVSPRSLGRATQRGCIWAALTSAGLTGRLHGITRRISGTHAGLIVKVDKPKAEVLVPNANRRKSDVIRTIYRRPECEHKQQRDQSVTALHHSQSGYPEAGGLYIQTHA